MEAAGEDTILVEIYTFAGSDDAYGLLSQDWGGESVSLAADWPAGERRALYGAGLLRIWTDNVFVRVMATLETAASRDAVLAVGRALVTGRPPASPPALLRAVPAEVAGRFRARLDRHVYLRSHLITAKRQALRGEPWPLSPPPLCVAAADEVYGLGTSRLDEIAIEAKGWATDLLV